MRTYIYILLIMLSFICSNQKASGQEREVQSVLIGTWALDYNATFSRMERQMKTLMDTMPQSQRSSIEKSFMGRIMIFEPNGNFIQTHPDGRDVKGTWSLDEKRGDIVITDPYGRRHIHRVRLLTDRDLVLGLEDSGDSKLFVKELYFIKN